MYLHPEADVRLVGPVIVHSVEPAHPRKGVRYVHIQDILEKGTHHTLERVKHIIPLDKGHLAVYLGELRLAVSPEVLVAEASDYLEIPVIACDHKKLLEGLRGLGQGIELSRVHAGRHHEVTCTFRCGLDEIWRFYFKETFAVKVVAHLMRKPVAKLEGFPERVPAQVEIPVFRPELLSAVADILYSERRSLRLVEYLYVREPDLNVACGHLGVPALALYDLSRSLDHVFTPE